MDLDPDQVKTGAIVALAVLVVVAFLVMRFIQKMVLRVILLGGLVGLGVYVYAQREELKDCVPECACTFFGFDVKVDGCPPIRDS